MDSTRKQKARPVHMRRLSRPGVVCGLPAYGKATDDRTKVTCVRCIAKLQDEPGV